MEIGGNGLRVWYDTPDAPAPPNAVRADSPLLLTVGVSPAHPSNTVEVRYRLNEGPELRLRAAPTHTDYTSGKQYFRAVFPYLPPDSEAAYGVIARCAGKRVGILDGGPLPSSFTVHPPASAPVPVQVSSNPPFPYHLEPITRATFKLTSMPEVIGVTPEGLHVDFSLAEGACRGKHLNGDVSRHGGDWMRIRTDGVGVPDIYVTVITAEKSLVLMKCSGKVDLGPNGYDDAIAGRFPDVAPVVVEGYFLGSEPEYAWLNRLQIVGVGYVKMKELRVEYDIYGIRSLVE